MQEFGQCVDDSHVKNNPIKLCYQCINQQLKQLQALLQQYIDQGSVLLTQKSYQEAIIIFNKGIKSCQDAIEALNMKGDSLRNLNFPYEAWVFYQRGLQTQKYLLRLLEYKCRIKQKNMFSHRFHFQLIQIPINYKLQNIAQIQSPWDNESIYPLRRRGMHLQSHKFCVISSDFEQMFSINVVTQSNDLNLFHSSHNNLRIFYSFLSFHHYENQKIQVRTQQLLIYKAIYRLKDVGNQFKQMNGNRKQIKFQ